MEPRIFAILIVTALLVVKTVGTPEITPVFGFKVKPVGSEPEETVKYQYTVLKEIDERELLSQEKEMLGIYVSGHPLEKLREAISNQTNITSIQIKDLNEENSGNFKDGQTVKYAGTITGIKKKYTKRNTIVKK